MDVTGNVCGTGEYRVTRPALALGGVMADGANGRGEKLCLDEMAGGVGGVGEKALLLPAGGEIGENVRLVGVWGDSDGSGDIKDGVLLAKLAESSRQ